MKNKNLLIIILAILLIGGIAAFSLLQGHPGIQGKITDEALPAETADTATPTPEEAATPTSMAYEAPEAYLLVQVGERVYQPIPLLKEGEFSIRQPESKMENVVHITRRGFWMVSSTCDNQDCVHQGPVSLDNMDSRVLGGMVICLPNQVSLELISPEQAESMMAQAASQSSEAEDHAGDTNAEGAAP